jgi:BA14K-like protein
MRYVGIIMGLVFCASQAHAEVKDYCAAYARDVADELPLKEPNWQRRHDNAEKDCLQRFAVTTPVPLKEKPKRVVKSKPPTVPVSKPKPEVPKPKAVVATKLADKPTEKPVEQKAAKIIPKLEPGSKEWLEYCEKKYASFDATKGTYMSRTGIERKCLVTAD